MEKLPPELILQVFSRLISKIDIANLRLVKRDFAQLGTEFMFNVINIRPTNVGIRPIFEVSHRPYLACYVKKVVLHLEDYRHLIWIPLKKELKSGAGEEARNSIKFAAALESTRMFQISSDYPAVLASSFCRLPNLEALEIREMSSPGYLDSTSSREMADYGLDAQRLYLCRQGKNFYVNMGIYRGFYALIAAAYFSNLKLVSFKSNALRLIDERRPDIEQEACTERSRVVLGNCQVLDLEFNERRRHPNGWVELFEPITSAARLEKLRIKFVTTNFVMCVSAGALLTDLFHSSWPCLKELKLENILMPENRTFFRFIYQHRNTLRRLSLQDCEVFDGSWMNVIKGIKQSLGHQLTKIELGSLFDHSMCTKGPEWHCIETCLSRIYSVEEMTKMLNSN